jgi:hypothetical protein
MIQVHDFSICETMQDFELFVTAENLWVRQYSNVGRTFDICNKIQLSMT